MLTCLRIRQLAVIEDVELDFGPGLTVLTGQTGAGKSVLVGALELVLGGRARADRVRAGAARLEVEALFEVGPDPQRRAALAPWGLEQASEVVLRRVVTAAGRSRATVGGQLATVGQLAALTTGWVDISSQHQQQTLTDADTHLDFLDAYAQLHDQRDGVGKAHGALAAAQRELGAAQQRLVQREERLEWLAFQLAELERVSPQPEELESLEHEAARLAHAERLAASAREAERELVGRDGAVAEVLARIERSMAQVASLDEAFQEWVEGLARARVEVEEVGRELGGYARGLSADPHRLEEVRQRLRELERLVRRHGSLEEALARREALTDERAQLEALDEALEAHRSAVGSAQARALELASALSVARNARAAELGHAITQELQALAMGQARVEVSVRSLERRSGLDIDGQRLAPTGLDHVEFLIAPNPGEEPRPLGRVASGGELSRALLALKRVLAGLGQASVYVFDEVDTGVGGAVAEAIGEKLADIAQHHQVLCITHQPQIAAWADHHLCVHKLTDGERAQVRVSPLDAAGRVEELARMLGGRERTDAGRAAARALLEQARRR